jgi:hypothetical protein
MKLPASLDKLLRELLGLCEHSEECYPCKRERVLSLDFGFDDIPDEDEEEEDEG